MTGALQHSGGLWSRPAPRNLARGRVLDPTRVFHPEEVARARSHARSCTHVRGAPCPARADDDIDDLDAIWAGRAGMARARKAAGKPLDPTDREALYRTGESDVV